MLLLFIVGSNLTDGMPQGQGLLAVVGHPEGQVFSILVEGQLVVPEHTVQVVPGPATMWTGRSPAVLTQQLSDPIALQLVCSALFFFMDKQYQILLFKEEGRLKTICT